VCVIYLHKSEALEEEKNSKNFLLLSHECVRIQYTLNAGEKGEEGKV